MKTDSELRQDVLDRLELEPKINPAELGVSVENGVVALTGKMETDEDRVCTERVVRLIDGVKGLVNDGLLVESKHRTRPQDEEIRAEAQEALRWLTTVPVEAIKITARDGWLMLEGCVESRHQARNIEELLRALPGVRGVKSALTILPDKKAA